MSSAPRAAVSAIALVLACGIGLLAPTSARAQAHCDWRPLWPQGGSETVSPYRNAFFLDGMYGCSVIDARLIRPDGSEVPMDAAVQDRSWVISLTPTDSGPGLELEPDTTYTIAFNWYFYEEDLPPDQIHRVPALPFTFRTSPSDEPHEPLTLDDLQIDRFELSRDASQLTFDAIWPDASPLYRIKFWVPSEPIEWRTHRIAYFFPALDGPRLRFNFPAERTRRRDETCAGVTFIPDSVLGGEERQVVECVDNGCSTVSATPPLGALGLVGLLVIGRRRRQHRAGPALRPASSPEVPPR